jgi:hypothetical protein
MVIRDLNIRSVSVDPPKTDTPLIIDPNGHLPDPIPLQKFEPVAGRIAQVIDNRGGIELAQLTESPILNFSWKPAAPLALPDPFSLLVFE